MSNFGSRKIERLGTRDEIRKLFSLGKRFHRSNLIVIHRPGKEQKVGFFASKNIGGAVKRNKVKRILREAYRMNRELFKGLHIIFYAQGPLNSGEVIEIFKSFKEGR